MEEVFAIFPKELWEMILDRVEGSGDMSRVFKAYPQLDLSFQGRKRYWLFGQVIAHLLYSNLLNEKDALNCREVCKQWAMRIDNFLQNQATLQAYHPEHNEEDRKENLNLFQSKVHEEAYYKYDWSCGIYFANVELTKSNIKSKIKLLENHPTTRNPFPARALTLTTSTSNPNEEMYYSSPFRLSDDAAADIFSLLQRFGHHVWFFRLDYASFSYDKDFVLYLLGISKLLQYLPNLKSLRIFPPSSDIKVPSSAAVSFNPTPFTLPHLESFQISYNDEPDRNVDCDNVTYLLQIIGASLQKLQLPVAYWNDDFFTMFQNLTELIIEVEDDWKENFKYVLASLCAPQLVLIRIFGFCKIKVEVKHNLFKWFKRFPRLKYFYLGNVDRLKMSEIGKLHPRKDRFPSLEILSIRDSVNLSYNFLHCLPRIRQLKIFVTDKPLVTDLSQDLSDSTVLRIREQLQTRTMYESNVWESLPKLETILLVDQCRSGIDDELLYFRRETYEKLKKVGKTTFTELGTLGRNIQEYLDIYDWDPEDCSFDSEDTDDDY